MLAVAGFKILRYGLTVTATMIENSCGSPGILAIMELQHCFAPPNFGAEISSPDSLTIGNEEAQPPQMRFFYHVQLL
jgi:hypothetical protein